MKKIKNLFERYEEGRALYVKPILSFSTAPYADFSRFSATRKWDGTACAVISGELYKRYDAKRGKTPPPEAIPCDERDAVTGHWPHWLKVDASKPEDKYFVDAWSKLESPLTDGTYELIGEKIGSNPEGIVGREFKKHGDVIVEPFLLDYEWILLFLSEHPTWEGLVIYLDGVPFKKTRRGDFKELTQKREGP